MVVVIWIDWYSYHLARLRALQDHQRLSGHVRGIELVGGAGVHGNLQFRENARGALPIDTLVPDRDWQQAGQRRLSWETWQRLNRLNPSVILVPGYYTGPALAAALWGKLRRRCTVLMTETTQQDHRRSGWKEWIKSRLLRGLFDWAVAGGEPHVRYLHELGFPPQRIRRRYDVVDNAFFAQQADLCRRNGPAPAQPYFLYLGRLAPEKHVDGLLRAYARYAGEGGQWNLCLVGDGPERSRLEALARELGIVDRTRWAGHRQASELPPYYAFAGCFVLPSTREPWGLVVNEAMASSLPVIVSSACGCQEDLVHEGRNGFPFRAGDPDELFARMSTIAGMPEAQRQAMGRQSHAIIQQFSPEAWAEEVACIVEAA